MTFIKQLLFIILAFITIIYSEHNIEFAFNTNIIQNPILRADKNISKFIDRFYVTKWSGILLFTGNIYNADIQSRLFLNLPEKIKINHVYLKVKNSDEILKLLFNFWLDKHYRNKYSVLKNSNYKISTPKINKHTYNKDIIISITEDIIKLNSDGYNSSYNINNDNYLKISFDKNFIDYIKTVEQKNKISLLLSKEDIEYIMIDNIILKNNKIQCNFIFSYNADTENLNTDDIIDDITFGLQFLKRSVRKNKIRIKYSDIKRNKNDFSTNITISKYNNKGQQK